MGYGVSNILGRDKARGYDSSVCSDPFDVEEDDGKIDSMMYSIPFKEDVEDEDLDG